MQCLYVRLKRKEERFLICRSQMSFVLSSSSSSSSTDAYFLISSAAEKCRVRKCDENLQLLAFYDEEDEAKEAHDQLQHDPV